MIIILCRHQFKLTRHLKFGNALTDSVEGAFASMNEMDVIELYTIISSLVKLKASDSKKKWDDSCKEQKKCYVLPVPVPGSTKWNEGTDGLIIERKGIYMFACLDMNKTSVCDD